MTNPLTSSDWSRKLDELAAMVRFWRTVALVEALFVLALVGAAILAHYHGGAPCELPPGAAWGLSLRLGG